MNDASTKPDSSAETTRVALVDLAHGRSGDKGDTANVGLIAYRAEDYDLLRREVTADAVRRHFGPMVGAVERFELPNLHALNFLLHEALDGGGTVSLMNDAQGKVFSTALLRMEIEVPTEVASAVRGRGRAPTEAGGSRRTDAGVGESAGAPSEGGRAGAAGGDHGPGGTA